MSLRAKGILEPSLGQAHDIMAEKPQKRGGDQKSPAAKSIAESSIDSQADRARENGVSLYTQKNLDKLADKRPDLLDRVRSGELTALTFRRRRLTMLYRRSYVECEHKYMCLNGR